jgi:hypothetical protein
MCYGSRGSDKLVPCKESTTATPRSTPRPACRPHGWSLCIGDAQGRLAQRNFFDNGNVAERYDLAVPGHPHALISYEIVDHA